MKKILLTSFMIVLLGAGCQKTEPPVPAPLPEQSAEETSPSPEPSTIEASNQENIEASFDTNDYLDEALKELDEVDE